MLTLVEEKIEQFIIHISHLPPRNLIDGRMKKRYLWIELIEKVSSSRHLICEKD